MADNEASISVYPREGTTFPDASGVTVTSAGATVLTSKYIKDAIRAGFLLTWDPLGIYLPEDRTGGGTGGGDGLAFDTAAQLGLFLGTTPGQVATTTGCIVRGDGGGGQWYWDSGSSTTADTGTCVGASPAGRWKRIYSGPVNARWFGAYGNGSNNDTPAITAALAAANHVFIPAGNYRLDTPVFLTDNKVLEGDGAATSLWPNYNSTDPTHGYEGFAIIIRNASNVSVKNLKIENLLNGRNGIKIQATATGLTMYPVVENVVFRGKATGETVCVDLITADLDSGNCNYFTRIEGCDIQSVPGPGTINNESIGVRFRGTSGSYSRSVGTRILNSRFHLLHTGIDADNVDTTVVEGCAFDGIWETNPPSTSGTGRAVKLRANCQQWDLRGNRFEDCDVFYDVAGSGHRFDIVQGPAAGTIINNSDGDIFTSGSGNQIPSQNQQATRFGRPAQFQSAFGLNYLESKTVAGGSTIQALTDDSGVVSPVVRLTGASSGFSLGSIRAPSGATTPGGTLKYVFNATVQACTLLNESGGGVPAERITTLTGGDLVVPGPCIMRFYYDASPNGVYGTGRWVYMGNG